MEGLKVRKHAGLDCIPARQIEARAAIDESPRRVVGFRRADAVGRAVLAVVAALVEVASPQERADATPRTVVELHVDVFILLRGVVVDGAPLARGNDGKAVGIERAALDRDPELPPHVAAKKIDLGAVAITVLRLDLDRAPLGVGRQDVDDAPHRVVAIQARARSIDHFDAIDAFERDARPVHPPAERIVFGDAIGQHECPADTARPDAAKRDALRRRMRREAAGAREQAECRNLAQHIVDDDRGRLSVWRPCR